MSTFTRLYRLQQASVDIENKYAEIKLLLDIGAYQGSYTKAVTKLWPEARFWQVEADERNAKHLQYPIIALLGNTVNKEVDFYTQPDDKDLSGGSILKDQSLTPELSVTLKKKTTTIDELCKNYNFDGDWANKGLIKINTKGSELMILEGARTFMKYYRPRFIQIECSLIEGNKGAPTIFQVMKALDKLGYHTYDVFDPIYSFNASRLTSIDVLFERNLPVA
jgi:FkbM family methyltransferase